MTPAPVASNPVLRRVLTVGALVTAALAVVGAVVGFLVAGPSGLVSALIGVVLAFLFLGITGASILIANRWNGDPLYPTLFFAIVLGGWLVKFVIFIVALMLLRGQPWMAPMVFFVALVVGVLATLVVDVIVMTKMRIPYVSDIDLPGEESLEQDDAADHVAGEQESVHHVTPEESADTPNEGPTQRPADY
ncbi:hypothetical protein [Microbacterium gorillae]|uniref:hypothetical protein n=1 Tax=Microbacterium gorillae TaxID=1231063 RepID=UPI000ADAE0E3|nr:hypothetical protein [Microbacterium gorillae]